MIKLYLFLASITVTLHVSEPSPTKQNPHEYSLNTCTGVFISPTEILTAGHCVALSRGHQWIKTDSDKSYAVEIEKLDKIKDLALLKIPDEKFLYVFPFKHHYAKLGDSSNKTQKVYTVNSGLDFEKTWNEGIINNFILEDDDILTILHNASLFPGASGSGLFNSKGELIGINVATRHSFSEAVDILEIKEFLGRS